jgi:1-acyl-sn-glycerol-3-phosphate acyltransferase
MVLTVLRRALMIPLVLMVELLLLATSPLTLAVGAVASVLTGSSRPIRTVALVLAYAAIELRVFCRIARADEDTWQSLEHDVLAAAYRALRSILDVHVELEPGSVNTAELAARGRPLVVLARHCGPGDSLFIAWLLTVHYGLRLTIVLKSSLRLAPSVDLASAHLPFCFVGAGGHRARRRIAAQAASMSAGDAFLLFPEGGNFSWPRWRQALDKLVRSGDDLAARVLRGHTHTLPPHHGGTSAALTGARQADVLLLAHSGFAPDGRDRPWWRLPVHRTMLMRTTLVPAEDVPREPAGITTWLDGIWSDVDEWVARRATAVGSSG